MLKGNARNRPIHDIELDKPILIHCCKDRTLTYRTRDEPIFNGVALPVFSVNTKEEAEKLVTLVGSRQYNKHPKLPNQPWVKINIGFKQELELTDLPDVTAKLKQVYALLKK